MKKIIVLLVFTVAISNSLFAQKNQGKKTEKKINAYIEAIESKLTLTVEEKVKIIALKTESIEVSNELSKRYKGKTELKEEKKAAKKEIKKNYSKSLIEAFGKDRANEIRMRLKKVKRKRKIKFIKQ